MITGVLLIIFATWLSIESAPKPEPLPCYVGEVANGDEVFKIEVCPVVYNE